MKIWLQIATLKKLFHHLAIIQLVKSKWIWVYVLKKNLCFNSITHNSKERERESLVWREKVNEMLVEGILKGELTDR
jgi:hypothetical protein